MPDRKQWKPNRRERRVILALLSGASNLSGWPLGNAAQVSSGSVYVCLARLERLGWVTGEQGPETGHGRRRFYRLTELGRSCGMKALGLEASDDA
jgi:DNA-binding PadR family transcriptional regulator